MPKKISYKIFVFIIIFLFQQKVFAVDIEGFPRIIDGDSLEINENKIRLLGIDAPEKKQTCKKPYLVILFFSFQKSYECGLLAKKELKKFIKKNKIRCISNDKDRYGRYLSTCYLKNTDINGWLVKNGYAIAYKKYSRKYILDEQYARKNKLGLWRGTFMEPEKWRRIVN